MRGLLWTAGNGVLGSEKVGHAKEGLRLLGILICFRGPSIGASNGAYEANE